MNKRCYRDIFVFISAGEGGVDSEEEWYQVFSVRVALAEMSAEERVLLQAYVEKDTPFLKHVAEREGVSLGAIYKRIERLIVRLRRQLEGGGEEKG